MKKTNVLVIHVSNNKHHVINLNYDTSTIYTKVEAVLTNWKKRGLSLMGKVLIINSLIATMFTYKMTVLPKMPDSLIKKLGKKFNEFIWDYKRPKIALGTLKLNKEDGGPGLCDLKFKDSSLKLSWIPMIGEDSLLEQLVYKQLCPILRVEIWNCNLKPGDAK